MKTFTKIVIGIFIFSFMTVSLAHADNSQEIKNNVNQLQDIIQIIQQNPNLQPILSPFIISLVSDLQQLLDQSNQDLVTDNNEDQKQINKTRTPYHIKNTPKISVDGYNEVGDDNNIALVIFEFELEASSDSDIELDGYDSFIFEIANVQYTGTELNNLDGYSIEITDSEDGEISSGYRINDGRNEEFEILVFVDARDTDQGSGRYKIEFDSIRYYEVDENRNSVLNINQESEEITLLQ